LKDQDDNALGLLGDAALDDVSGGVKDGCIPGRPLPQTYPTAGWTFKDVFAKPTLGH
jgi:hypothetical protein